MVKGPGMVSIFPPTAPIPSDAAKKPFPTVVVIQEIFGVHEHIKDMCRRFAKRGYFAIAPDLYARQGDVSQMANIGDIITKVVSKVPDAQVTGDIDATLAYAHATGFADDARDRRHGLLLGWSPNVALCRPQSQDQGRRCLVRPARRSTQ